MTIKDIFRKVICKAGLHAWNQSNPITLYDLSPSPFDSLHRTPTRTCKSCGKEQEWIPGYGGSEIGCCIFASFQPTFNIDRLSFF